MQVGSEVNKTMAGLAKALPMYVWLVALPQLCSRLTHPHAECVKVTRNIITRVFMEYPQQVCEIFIREPLGHPAHLCFQPPAQSWASRRGPSAGAMRQLAVLRNCTLCSRTLLSCLEPLCPS